MGEQEVVHGPERVLRGGRFRCLGRRLGVEVHVGEREVPPHVAHVGEVAQQFADLGFRPPAVRALEVAVLHDGDRRIERPADVVTGRIDVVGEIDQRRGAAEQRLDPRGAGQELRRPDDDPGQGGGQRRCAEEAQLGLVQAGSGEREAGHQQGHGEPDASDGARADDCRPADRRA